MILKDRSSYENINVSSKIGGQKQNHEISDHAVSKKHMRHLTMENEAHRDVLRQSRNSILWKAFKPGVKGTGNKQHTNEKQKYTVLREK